jgi:hypothetical protein
MDASRAVVLTIQGAGSHRADIGLTTGRNGICRGFEDCALAHPIPRCKGL